MTHKHDTPMAEQPQISEADVWLSRVNIAHARSQRLLQSWLSQSTTTATTAANNEDNEEEDDFTGMTESAGLGTTAVETEYEVDGILKKRHASSHDKLLEQLLGKKVAAAKKKEAALKKQEKSDIALGRRTGALPTLSAATNAGPSSAAGQSNPAPVIGAHREADDDEESDEPGRTAIFTANSNNRRRRKITRDRNLPAYTTGGEYGELQGRNGRASPIDVAATPPDPREDPATIVAMMNGTSQAEHELVGADSHVKEEQQGKKRKKGTSYLDELLSKKKKKKQKVHAKARAG